MHGRLVSRRIDALHQCFLVSFGTIGLIVVYGVLLMYTLEGVSNVTNFITAH